VVVVEVVAAAQALPAPRARAERSLPLLESMRGTARRAELDEPRPAPVAAQLWVVAVRKRAVAAQPLAVVAALLEVRRRHRLPVG
jgi:hypothetical protein